MIHTNLKIVIAHGQFQDIAGDHLGRLRTTIERTRSTSTAIHVRDAAFALT